MNILKHFVIYGIAGFVLEVLWTGLGSAFRGDKNLRCHTYLWMFFIYGAVVFLEPLHNLIRPLFFFQRGIIWAVLFFAIEYGSGFLLKKTTGNVPWDYSGESALSVQGIIRLDYFPVWFMAGLLFEKMHDIINLVL